MRNVALMILTDFSIMSVVCLPIIFITVDRKVYIVDTTVDNYN
jgi:hypothetical protein